MNVMRRTTGSIAPRPTGNLCRAAGIPPTFTRLRHSVSRLTRAVSLRVLMFGWQFPPFQAGGLGTATQGLVQGLLYGTKWFAEAGTLAQPVALAT